MRVFLIIASCSAALVLTCASALGQDTSRVPDVSREPNQIDFSVHAALDEQAVQPPELPKKSKSTLAYSRWAFQPETRPPATQFWPARPVGPTLAAAGAENLSTPDSPPSQPGTQTPLFPVGQNPPTDSKIMPAIAGPPAKINPRSMPTDGLQVGHPHADSMSPQLFKTLVLPPAPQSTNDRFTTPFGERQFELTRNPNFQSSFSRTASLPSPKQAKEKRLKHHLQKLSKPTHTETSLDSALPKEN